MDHSIREHLTRDTRLRPLVEAMVLPDLPGDRHDLYFNLVRAILFQQLAGKAANTILSRFLNLFPQGYPHPEHLAGLDVETLRSVGLSRQKAGYVQNIARFFLEENTALRDWPALSDDEVIAYLTQIKGVGRWTVEMILIFTLGRPDVFPLDDWGIRQAILQLYEIDPQLPPRQIKQQLLDIAEAWRPYRSYACRYLWQWKDTPP